jgi:hypothetical protein
MESERRGLASEQDVFEGYREFVDLNDTIPLFMPGLYRSDEKRSA